MSSGSGPGSGSGSVPGAEEGPPGERIAKRLARAGLCSRREAERWIAAGRVVVNGSVLSTPAITVSAGDTIVVDGLPLPAAEAPRLWRYHKAPGLVVTHRDPQGRPTVFDDLPKQLPRLVSVGRLDLTSEGLLLLTNDGALARHLELPDTGWTRRYRARVHGAVDTAALSKLAKGVRVDGVRYGPIQVEVESRDDGTAAQRRANTWLVVSLAEGRNREVRNVLGHLGLVVNRLIRVAYGPFQLGRLPRGAVSEVRRKVLLEQVGREFAG